MFNRENINDAELMARHNVVELAQAMLDGTLSFFEGAPQIFFFKNKIVGDKDTDTDFDKFLIIISETDHLPRDQQRALWSPDALEKLRPEFNQTEKWASSFAREACSNLIARFKTD